jgi:hypothetical protein
MRSVPDWSIQVAWWASGIFATGGAWYFLSAKELVLAAGSAVCAVVLAAVAVALHRRKDAIAEAAVPRELQSDLPDSYVRRYSDDPSHVRVVTTLPDLKSVVYRSAEVGWSSPVTKDMTEGCYEAVDFLEFAWLRVAEFFPHKHFGRNGARGYIEDYIRSRYKFHRARHEPGGPGTGGTIVGPLTGADVVADLEKLIEETVGSLFLGQDDFDFHAWRERWYARPPTTATAGDA